MTPAPSGDRYVVIGAAGQLGHDLLRTFDRPGAIVGLTRRDLDVLDAGAVARVLAEARPTVVLNTAAYNRVDQAETEPAAAFALNAEAPGTLAAACERLGAVFVHFSTDYVFDGARATPYRETDVPEPLSVYGASKLRGEELARERCRQCVVFRVSGLFGVAGSSGKGGGNFVETMLRLAREGRTIRVVSDQVLGPSYTLDLARKVWKVLPARAHALYHLTNAGATSWYDFARRVFALAGLAPTLEPVSTAEYGARARRPAYSVLAHDHLRALGEDDLRPWDAALADYLSARSSAP